MGRLNGSEAERYCREGGHGKAHPGVLLHGDDAGHVGEMRRCLVRNLAEGDADVATRFEAAEARRDPAALHDALRSAGLFGERPTVLLTGASDGMTDIVMSALEGLDSRVGVLVVEAGTLSKRSSLRRSFEEARGLMSLGFPTQRAVDRRRLEASLEEAGLAVGLTGEALASLSSHAAEADCGSLARTLESIAIYGLDASAPLTAEEVAALLPVTSETEVDRLVEGLVVGRPDEVVLQLGRLIAGGSSDVAIVIQIGGFFRQLLEARVLGGVDALRPPVWGQRRASLISAMDTWREVEIEDALQALHATDAALRSGKAYPMRATLERALAKLSVTAAARRTTRDRR